MQMEKKSINDVNFFLFNEYNNSDLQIKRRNNMSTTSHYCPILGKRVKIKGDFKETPKNTSRHTAVCQNSKKECDGNCEGCMMLVNN